MDRVAIGADDIGLRVSALADIGAGERLGVAAQAGGESFLGPDFGKSNDGRLAPVGRDMGFSGPVTALAASIFGRFLSARDALVVRVTEELIEHRSMTGLAGVAADVIGGQRNRGPEEGGLRHSKQLHSLISTRRFDAKLHRIVKVL
jgi:hypothetical protein